MQKNTLGILAVWYAGAGSALTLLIWPFPGLAFLAIPLLFTAFVLSLISVFQKNKRMSAGITALALSLTFGVIAPLGLVAAYFS